jgi:hypothetical protein
MNKHIFEDLIHIFLRKVPTHLLFDYSSGRIDREFCWTNHKFSSVDMIPPWFSMPIYHQEDE